MISVYWEDQEQAGKWMFQGIGMNILWQIIMWYNVWYNHEATFQGVFYSLNFSVTRRRWGWSWTLKNKKFF